MKLKALLMGAALASAVALTATQASAAFVGICDNAASEGGCPALGTSSSDPNIKFLSNDFEGTFQVNSVVVQQGLGSPNSTSVSESSGSVNPVENDFAGVWILGGPIVAQNETIFFVEPGGGISDVLHYTYSSDANGFGHLDGFVMSDVTGTIDPAFLSGRLITATKTLGESRAYDFSNTNITAIFQSATPEPATWAMMLLGFGGLGVSLRMRRRSQALAA